MHLFQRPWFFTLWYKNGLFQNGPINDLAVQLPSFFVKNLADKIAVEVPLFAVEERFPIGQDVHTVFKQPLSCFSRKGLLPLGDDSAFAEASHVFSAALLAAIVVEELQLNTERVAVEDLTKGERLYSGGILIE